MTLRLIALVVTLAFALAALSVSEHSQPNAGLPVVNADYTECTRVQPGPLVPPRRDVFKPEVNGDLS